MASRKPKERPKQAERIRKVTIGFDKTIPEDMDLLRRIKDAVVALQSGFTRADGADKKGDRSYCQDVLVKDAIERELKRLYRRDNDGEPYPDTGVEILPKGGDMRNRER